MRTRRALALILATLPIACGPGPTGRAPLRVAAASDLQTALPKVVERFEQDSGVPVDLTFGASGLLAAQIEQGAPFDVFLAANRGFVDRLARSGAVRPDSVRPYTRGTLILAVHRDAASHVASLDDLTKPEVKRIALANPEVAPYGGAGKQALERAGLWDVLKPKIVQSETVRQALQFVQSGNADVGLVGKAIADVPAVRVVTIDPGLYDPIVQGLGIVAGSKRPEDAERFARFLLGDDGQRILAEHGFQRPGP